jgi:hypothetical protein
VLRGLERPGPRRAPHELALFTRVANRLAEPLSRLACYEHWVPERGYLPEAEGLTLEQVYCALDCLDTHIDAVAREIFFRTADLFRAEVDLIFWDTPTLAFEIDAEDERDETRRGTTRPPLRQRGYRQERGDHKPQVVVGLALPRDGLPVRSWVVPGHTVDATTVAQGKEGLRGWRLGQAICVGAAGMDAAANRQELAKGVGHDILAMPMGKLTEGQQAVLARPGRFHPVNDQLEVQEVVGDGARHRRYLVCRHRAEAERQRQHRAEALAALRQELDRLDPHAPEHTQRACELVASRRYGRYLARGPGGADGRQVGAADPRRHPHAGGRGPGGQGHDAPRGRLPADEDYGAAPPPGRSSDSPSHHQSRSALCAHPPPPTGGGDPHRGDLAPHPAGARGAQGRTLPRTRDHHRADHTSHGAGDGLSQKAGRSAPQMPALGRPVAYPPRGHRAPRILCWSCNPLFLCLIPARVY